MKYFGLLLIIILIQVILSSVVLARQHDVDLLFYDAWGDAKATNEALLEKIEKSVWQPFDF
jgi:hypothetical protein